MKVIIFCNKMPDLCGAFIHDIDLGLELQRRGHQVTFMCFLVPKIRYQIGTYRGFTYMHYTAGNDYLERSDVWICPHSPILPNVRKLNSRGYDRPIVATCHFDGNYEAISGNVQPSFNEMLLFINKIMEQHYRKNIVPWPSSIKQTNVVRPILHRDKIVITEPFQGDCITLINANENKGVRQFIDIARSMPDRKFLGVLPYYGEKQVPSAPSNVQWVPFDDDIRTILKRTRILLMPSYYESFGRVAVESMINGIPVIYSKPNPNSIFPGGSTEGVEGWIGNAAVSCERDRIEEWVTEIKRLDDPDIYSERSQRSKQHIDSMNLFTEAARISDLIETFSKAHPPPVRQTMREAAPSRASQTNAPVLRAPGANVRVGFVNGQLKIPR